jgi:hypothetical protein
MGASWEWLRSKWPNPLVTALMQRAKLIPWNKQAWIVDLAATAAILLPACWIAYSDRTRLRDLSRVERRPSGNIYPCQSQRQC